MQDRRRIYRQPCDLEGRIYVLNSDDASNECKIIDLSTHGAFIRPASDVQLPPKFDLTIGNGNASHSCRLARISGDGFGIEFLDPVRDEIEKALIEAAFREELLFDYIAGISRDKSLMAPRLRRAVAAMMEIIEQRNSMTWHQAADGGERTQVRARSAA
ncbi:PilZ domain-containing protein [Methylobacterium iners]|uniref:PilZ domain-containing protein n=1 Tax=Methylobacterium iners TaxID=418707 RepID=UPI0024B5E3B1|nr:PilZ domain-containing protein [Methylobacterium iners]